MGQTPFSRTSRMSAHQFFKRMSLYNDDRYSWRETYFVLFDPERRLRLRELRRELRKHSGTFRILEENADTEGVLTSMIVASYEDHSALEINYREGKNVADEIRGLIETLENGCTPRERLRLRQAADCRARFDVLHFEQTADTAAFKIVKMPELRFAPPKPYPPKDKQTYFPKEQRSDKLNAQPGVRPRFHFDPDSYENCVNDGAGSDLDEQEVGMDSSIIERVDPNTLVLFLEILCLVTDGIAIDPASGIVI